MVRNVKKEKVQVLELPILPLIHIHTVVSLNLPYNKHNAVLLPEDTKQWKTKHNAVFIALAVNT